MQSLSRSVTVRSRFKLLLFFFQPKRLVEEQCAKSDLVEMLFTDDWMDTFHPLLSNTSQQTFHALGMHCEKVLAFRWSCDSCYKELRYSKQILWVLQYFIVFKHLLHNITQSNQCWWSLLLSILLPLQVSISWIQMFILMVDLSVVNCHLTSKGIFTLSLRWQLNTFLILLHLN